MQVSECDLIESFAEELSCRLFQRFAIAQSVTIEVLKPDAPVSGSFDSFGIEIARTRDG
jgi:dihydroneopterin aldolase